MALLLYAGKRGAPLVLVCTLVAASVNYHRPMLSWCGIPGATLAYCSYFVGAAVLRGRWRIDPQLATLRDVLRFVLILFTAEIFSSVVGMLTLWGDGFIRGPDALRAAVDWWASDAISMVTFAPFLLIWVAPRVVGWLRSEADYGLRLHWFRGLLEPNIGDGSASRVGGASHLVCIRIHGPDPVSALVFAFYPSYLGDRAPRSSGSSTYHADDQLWHDVRSLADAGGPQVATPNAIGHACTGADRALPGSNRDRTQAG